MLITLQDQTLTLYSQKSILPWASLHRTPVQRVPKGTPQQGDSWLPADRDGLNLLRHPRTPKHHGSERGLLTGDCTVAAKALLKTRVYEEREQRENIRYRRGFNKEKQSTILDSQHRPANRGGRQVDT